MQGKRMNSRLTKRRQGKPSEGKARIRRLLKQDGNRGRSISSYRWVEVRQRNVSVPTVPQKISLHEVLAA